MGIVGRGEILERGRKGVEDSHSSRERETEEKRQKGKKRQRKKVGRKGENRRNHVDILQQNPWEKELEEEILRVPLPQPPQFLEKVPEYQIEGREPELEVGSGFHSSCPLRFLVSATICPGLGPRGERGQTKLGVLSVCFIAQDGGSGTADPSKSDTPWHHRMSKLGILQHRTMEMENDLWGDFASLSC